MLTDEMKVRLLYGDTPTSPFYQLLTSEEVLWLLEKNRGNIQAAARDAAFSASFQLAGWATRERTGSIEIWSNLANSYQKALNALIQQKVFNLPDGLMPYAAGISWKDIEANNSNPDNVRPAITQIDLCEDKVKLFWNCLCD